MKIAVIGAGIIGVTTAYELACDGHEVTVLERRGAAAEESSFGNAGIVAPGYVTPWSTPAMPRRAMQRLLRRFAPVKLNLPLSPQELGWIWKWYRAYRMENYLTNRANLARLCFYSRERLHHTTARLKQDYERSDGLMVLLRSERDSRMVQIGLQVLREAGISFQELDPVATRKIEPALNPDRTFFGSVHLPDDEVGNCRQFALLLKNEAQRMGVKFCFNTNVTRIVSTPRVAISLADETTSRTYDAAVISAGVDSAQLLASLGIHVPLAAVHGYSITSVIREPLNAPRSAVIDEYYKVAITRLGNRVRVAGSAELGGSPSQKRASSLQTLYKVLHDWFPGAANLSAGVQEWKGARPMLPDGPPIFGPSGIQGIWLNLGHGASGWALGSGCARALADQIKGSTPALDVSGFGVHRLGIRIHG